MLKPLTGGRFLSKLHHLPQTHTRGRKGRVVLDGVHQPLRRLPRHLEGSLWPLGLVDVVP